MLGNTGKGYVADKTTTLIVSGTTSGRTHFERNPTLGCDEFEWLRSDIVMRWRGHTLRILKSCTLGRLGFESSCDAELMVYL